MRSSWQKVDVFLSIVATLTPAKVREIGAANIISTGRSANAARVVGASGLCGSGSPHSVVTAIAPHKRLLALFGTSHELINVGGVRRAIQYRSQSFIICAFFLRRNISQTARGSLSATQQTTPKLAALDTESTSWGGTNATGVKAGANCVGARPSGSDRLGATHIASRRASGCTSPPPTKSATCSSRTRAATT